MHNLDPIGGTVVTRSQATNIPTTNLGASLSASIRKMREFATAPRSPELIARQLPDSLFDHDPEVRQLRVLLRIEEHRANGATTVVADQVGSVIPALEAKVKTLRAGLEIAALDDAIGADFEFPGAVTTMEEIQRLEAQIKAARLAYALLSKSPPLKQPYFAERVSRARDALDTRLVQLKRAHLADHPELLDRPTAGVQDAFTTDQAEEQQGEA